MLYRQVPVIQQVQEDLLGFPQVRSLYKRVVSVVAQRQVPTVQTVQKRWKCHRVNFDVPGGSSVWKKTWSHHRETGEF